VIQSVFDLTAFAAPQEKKAPAVAAVDAAVK
jgi:hypothetical protein